MKLIFTDYSADEAHFRVSSSISEDNTDEIKIKMLDDFKETHCDEMEEYLAMADTQRVITRKRKNLLKKLKVDFETENKLNYPEYYL